MVDLYDFGIRASFLLLAPLLWWAAPHADLIVALIFGHGAFTGAMVGQVGAILMALVPSILLIGVNQLLSNAFYAMGRVAVPALMMPLTTIAYALAAGPVSARLGPPGLTLTTTLVHLALFFGLVAALARALPELRAGRLLWHLAGYTVLSGFCIMASTMLADALGAGGIGTAVLTLTAGSLLYAAMLFLSGEATLRRILAAGRGIFVARRAAA
jgi:peptidoglycan biosynthesis protein MviN/MurJ (putative lipid II flippase)